MAEEIEKLLSMLLWMGLCTFPTIQSYWKKKVMYTNFLKSTMSRNRFQLLFQTLHFHNNEEITEDRLQKITQLAEKLRCHFKMP